MATESNDSAKTANPQKICGVCGDKALGFNFSAISCESCKAFFRRNALASKEFKCPFAEQCDITVLTRKFCQKCRLEKCFAIGMVKEYIMTEEDKAQKRQKIEQNRAKKRQTQKSTDDEVSSSKIIKREDNDNSSESWTQNNRQFSPSSIDSYNSANIQYDILNSTTNSPIVNQNVSDNAVEEFAINPPMHIVEHSIAIGTTPQQSFHNCLFNGTNEPEYKADAEVQGNTVIRSILTPTPSTVANTSTSQTQLQSCEDSDPAPVGRSDNTKTDVTRDILQDVERIPIEPNSIESILCEAIKLEFEAYSSIAQSNNSSRELNDAERAKLNELIVANKALLAPLDDDMSNLLEDSRFKPTQSRHDPALLGLINLTAVAIRRLIKMAKKINAFKNMCEEDQVALLKGGCTEMMILRSTMTYDCVRDTWKIPHSQEELSNIKADLLKLAKGNIYQEHDRFIRTFDPRWRLDENIVLIMSAILLFTPDRPRVVHSDVIKLEQNSYYYLLRRYLESVYPGCEAKSTFLKLIQKIMELHKLADEVIGVYLDVNPIEPLLIEIFDLKQH